jgi:hypothetical protein
MNQKNLSLAVLAGILVTLAACSPPPPPAGAPPAETGSPAASPSP